jgi:hypothetical protein
VRLAYHRRFEMRHCTKLGLAAIASLLAGCNQPAVTPKAPALQSSANTIRDWNDVAHRIASDMASRGLLPNSAQPGPTAALPPKPVFVRIQAPDSAFVRAVAAQLESDILDSGAVVARNPAGATVVNLDVNFFQWGLATSHPAWSEHWPEVQRFQQS